MYKYIRFAILGAFFTPLNLYWIILAACASVILLRVLMDHIHLGDYLNPEQVYNVTFKYTKMNGKFVPVTVFVDENDRQRPIPKKDTEIKPIGSGIYDLYCRIKRKDGDGYDYVAAVLKRIDNVHFETVRISSGKEITG